MPQGDPTERALRAAEEGQAYRAGWRMAGLGWEFLSHVLAGLLLGWGVDWAFGVRPWGMVGGTVAGVLVGGVQFVRRAIRLNASLGPVRPPPGGWRKIEDPEEEAGEDSPDAPPGNHAERRR